MLAEAALKETEPIVAVTEPPLLAAEFVELVFLQDVKIAIDVIARIAIVVFKFFMLSLLFFFKKEINFIE